MREIKFRGKRVDNGEWVFGDYGQFHKRDGDWTHEIHCPIPKISGSYWNEVIPETFGQFTGLHDKNGVEIYEGDVVAVVTDYRKPLNKYCAQAIKYYAVVEEDSVNPCFVLHKINSDFCEYDFVKCGMTTLKVIGNIHDGGDS